MSEHPLKSMKHEGIMFRLRAGRSWILGQDLQMLEEVSDVGKTGHHDLQISQDGYISRSQYPR